MANENTVVVQCEDRHAMEGALRSLSLAWGRPSDREAHRAMVVRHKRAMRFLGA